MRHTFRRPAVLLAAVALIGAVGCSSGDSGDEGSADAAAPTANGSSDYRSQALSIGREYARCARENGSPNFPDPAIQDGALAFPGVSKTDLETTGAACAEIAQRLPAPPPQQAEPPSDEMFALQQRYARCARENGVPEWPDPRRDGSDPFAGTELGRIYAIANLGIGGRVPQRLIDVRFACEQIEFEMSAQTEREGG